MSLSLSFIPSRIWSYKGFNNDSEKSNFDLNISLAPFNKEDFLNPEFDFNKFIYLLTKSLSNFTISPMQVPTYLLVFSSSNFGVFNNQVISPSY